MYANSILFSYLKSEIERITLKLRHNKKITLINPLNQPQQFINIIFSIQYQYKLLSRFFVKIHIQYDRILQAVQYEKQISSKRFKRKIWIITFWES